MRRHTCPVVCNTDMMSPAAHCAGWRAGSAGHVVTPACLVLLWSATSYSRSLEKLCASLLAAETPAHSSMRRRHWSATQGTRTPIPTESPWCKNTAGHHARRSTGLPTRSWTACFLCTRRRPSNWCEVASSTSRSSARWPSTAESCRASSSSSCSRCYCRGRSATIACSMAHASTCRRHRPDAD